MSRSMHRSQGMGSPERKGSAKTSLMTIAGDAATHDLFDGVDITWKRFPGGSAVGQPLAEAARTFDPTNPVKTVPLLVSAYKAMAQMHQPLVDLKRRELEDAIALCSGLWLDASADKFAAVPGGSWHVNATAVNRSRLPIEVSSVNVDGIAQASAKGSGGPLPFNQSKGFGLEVKIPANQPLSQPYWLREPKQGETYNVPDQLEIGLAENSPLLRAHFEVHLAGADVNVVRPVIYRYIERAQGELTRPIVVEPPVALQWARRSLLFPGTSAKNVELHVTSNTPDAGGTVRIQPPAGWGAAPDSQTFELSNAGQEAALSFRLTPPASDTKGALQAGARVGDATIGVGMETISYPHIPPQVLFFPARTELVRSDVKLAAKTIGYIMGAGDDIPDALRELGADVTLLDAGELAAADLSRFDAIVTGVRAYNTRPDLRANQQRLMKYVQDGGTLVVQYITPQFGGRGGRGRGGRGPAAGRGAPAGRGDQAARGARPIRDDDIGPYPISIGGGRVTVEEAPVQFPNPANPLLHTPNEITARDFEGWIQERGPELRIRMGPALSSPCLKRTTPASKPLLGGTLYTRYGKGAYVFTAFSWFRELPAGVPGAFRIFAESPERRKNAVSKAPPEHAPPRRTDEPPPFLGTWNRVYLFVVCYLACVIVAFYLFSRAFAP